MTLPPNDKDGLMPCREAFEKWYSQGNLKCPSIKRSGDGYLLAQAHCDWIAWQAAWNTKPDAAQSGDDAGVDKLEAGQLICGFDVAKGTDIPCLTISECIDGNIIVRVCLYGDHARYVHSALTAKPDLSALIKEVEKLHETIPRPPREYTHGYTSGFLSGKSVVLDAVLALIKKMEG